MPRRSWIVITFASRVSELDRKRLCFSWGLEKLELNIVMLEPMTH